MFKRLREGLSEDLFIDLGTANTLIFARRKGVVLNEASVVAVRVGPNGKKVVAVGNSAKAMRGRTPGSIYTMHPLKDGVIADFTHTELMLRYFIKEVYHSEFLTPRPRVLMAIPCGATPVERRAIRDAADAAGAREVSLIEEPLAAAIGAGMPVGDASASMVIDIGGGSSEIAVISLKGAAYSDSLPVGGFRLEQAIVNYVRCHTGIVIGEATAERIIHAIGCAYPPNQVSEIDVRGRNLSEGIPRSLRLNSNEILEALQNPLALIVSAVAKALEQIPPELGADLVERGMVLTGGGALLTDVDRLLAEETGISVHVAEDPLTSVARGGGRVLEMDKDRLADMCLSG